MLDAFLIVTSLLMSWFSLLIVTCVSGGLCNDHGETLHAEGGRTLSDNHEAWHHLVAATGTLLGNVDVEISNKTDIRIYFINKIFYYTILGITWIVVFYISLFLEPLHSK